MHHGEELSWMSGYLSALLQNEAVAATETSAAVPAMESCTVVYGTETGNSKKVATDFSTRLKKQGVPVKLKSLDQYRLNDIAKESCLLVVISTQGDGEPPAAAKKFYDYLQENTPALNNLKYSVLALGDSAYPLFCKAGEDVDVRLTELGAQRIIPLKKCDTDYEEDVHAWADELVNATLSKPGAETTVAPLKTKPAKSGKKVYEGTVVTSIDLNDRGSSKETYHIEISADETIEYEPGDSIGIIAYNKPAAVAKVIELLDANAEQHYEFRIKNIHYRNCLPIK